MALFHRLHAHGIRQADEKRRRERLPDMRATRRDVALDDPVSTTFERWLHLERGRRLLRAETFACSRTVSGQQTRAGVW